MLWAHAAGCPCSNWLHCIAGRLISKNQSSNNDSSGGSSSSSSINSSNNSSSSNSSRANVGGDMVTDSRWNAVLFRLCYTDFRKAANPVLSMISVEMSLQQQ
jgi:hypothetical protein